MDSATLMIQAISQNFAIFFCALFAGGSVYISLVEDPATAKGGVKMAGAYLLTAHPRPAIVQTIFVSSAALSGILAGIAGGTVWWLAGGSILGVAALLQLFKLIPMVKAVAGASREANPARLNRRLGGIANLHAVIGLASLAALFIFIMKS